MSAEQDTSMVCRPDFGGCGAGPGERCASDCENAAAAAGTSHRQRPTMMQATATGLALLALRERGFTVDELSPMQLRVTAPDAQAFILTVEKA